MQKLLLVALLLAGCTLHQASAQQAPVTPPTAAATGSSPTPALHWAAAEFCEAYAQYYSGLPSLYRYNAGQALQQTPLAAPNADVAALLLHQDALRETVYQTIYQYCHTLKYGLNNSSEVEELLHQFLYEDLHMSDLAAAYLAPQIAHRYRQPAPAAVVEIATPVAARSTTPIREQPRTIYTPKGGARGSFPARPLYGEPGSASELELPRTPDAPALYGEPGISRRPPEYHGGMEVSGWRFATAPTIAVIDDTPGMVRFKIKIAGTGEVEAVTRISGNVSPAQEKLCQEKLLNTHFVKTNAGAGAATGYYTFRISVR